jgi:hypothetical protein
VVTADDGGGLDASTGTGQGSSTGGTTGVTDDGSAGLGVAVGSTEAGGGPGGQGGQSQAGGGLESGTAATSGKATEQVLKSGCGCHVISRPFGSSYESAALAFVAVLVARRRSRRSTR